MNLGWYEIMDRLAMIQDSLEGQVYTHPEGDVKLQCILNTVQASLNQAYQYSAKKFDESCEGKESDK